jgi:hypothetical protein
MVKKHGNPSLPVLPFQATLAISALLAISLLGPSAAAQNALSEPATNTQAESISVIEASAEAIEPVGPVESAEPPAAVESTPPIDAAIDAPASATLSRSQRIDRLEVQLSRFEVTERDAADLFNQLRDETRMRLWQFDMALDQASSTSDRARIDPALLEEQHPGFKKQIYLLPPNIVTMRDLYLDTLDTFFARSRMLELVSPELRDDAVGSELYGMQELRSERDLIILEIRYQALRVPRAFQQIRRMAWQAPVPLIWIVFQFWLAIFLFRWWRRWFPGTLARMRASLLAIRPRSEEVMTRVRGLWYIGQIRPPLEWLILWTFLFSLLQFDGLDFIRDVGLIVVRWIMLTWFAVALLNAYVTRSSGGLSGETAQLRLKSMRLVAGWLLLLGMSVDLSTDLVGDGAITAWIWHTFELLLLPLGFVLLSVWHMELYTRLEREGEPSIPRDEYAAQRGLRRWMGSAKVLGLLVASWLRAVLIRRIEQFGSVRAAAGLTSADSTENSISEDEGLAEEVRATLIKGHDAFTKYAALERRALVERIDAGTGGMIDVIGERGIGKNGFLRQVANVIKCNTVFLDCRAGNTDDVIADFSRQLEINVQNVDDEALNAALEAKNIGFIALFDFHLLVRPVMGGISNIAELAELRGRITTPVVWGISIDRYAYQLIARLRAGHLLADNQIQLRPWSEEQIGEFVQNRCELADLQPDFSSIKVPRQYMDVAQDAIEGRNRVGIYTMLTSLSRGNPSIAIRLFADCIRITEGGGATVTLPANRDDQLFKDRPINLLLVLRIIAQVELITFDDIVANLQLEPSIVLTALQFARSNGWVEERHGRYRITWPWLRVITQVLGRQNLLAGVRQGAA